MNYTLMLSPVPRRCFLVYALLGVLAVSLGAGIRWFSNRDWGVLFPISSFSTSTPVAISSLALLAPTSSAPGVQTYRNTEYGFEFQYPQGWAVEENAFGSYYSKFNVVVVPAKERHPLAPVLVNIVLPEFAYRTFQGIEKVSEVTVAGLPGIKYEYEFEEEPETAIVLPFGEYKMILGTTTNNYEDVFEQVFATFKFLKRD